MTENKGKDAPRSDNVVYDYSRLAAGKRILANLTEYETFAICDALILDVWNNGLTGKLAYVANALHSVAPEQSNPSDANSLPISPNTSVDVVSPIAYEDGVRINPLTMQPISASDANLTPGDAILRDDEK